MIENLPFELTISDLQKILASLYSPATDYADIYCQYYHGETLTLEDGILKDAHFNVNKGVGIRVISGEKTGFAYGNDFQVANIQSIAKRAASIINAGQSGKTAWGNLKPVTKHDLYQPLDPLLSMHDSAKLAMMKNIEKTAFSMDSRVSRVIVSLSSALKIMLVAASDESYAFDIRPGVRLNVSAVVSEKGKNETGRAGGGGKHDYNYFVDNDRYLFYAKEAVRIALLNLEAKPSPAGVMPVILGPGWPGVLLHESIGHGLEGDFIRKKNSVFTGKLNQRIATDECTIVDNGALQNGMNGSLNVDDEGTKTGYTVLIEKGKLKGYMLDKLNARLLGMTPTGNGRRESYASVPIPRMTNTYMLAGKHHQDEIISSVKKGIYAVNFEGGEVDITSGKFVFTTSEAYLIENGKITTPIKHATLIGDGPTVLQKVSMVGDDLHFDPGIGTCGKDGQSASVSVGQPTLKVDEITIGGTEI